MSHNSTTPIAKSYSRSNGTQWARMKSGLLTLLTINLSFLAIECGLDVEDPSTPLPPVWVQKSLPEEWPERGIDAHESGGIYLEWEPSLEVDIVAYKVYRAIEYDINDTLGNYELLSQLEVVSIAKCHYIDRQVTARTNYFYKIKSVNNADNSSEFSDSVFYSLLPQLHVDQMTPNGQEYPLGQERRLTWRSLYGLETEYYNLTILTVENEFVARVVLLPGNYVSGDESWQIPEDIVLISGGVYKWRIESGACYSNGYETIGSESPWATFKYVE
jgi:hypothetical protein